MRVITVIDSNNAPQHPHLVEETPLHLSESVVEVAADYTKRKNVFRVRTNGEGVGGGGGGSDGGCNSEFLFQAEGEDSMRDWVTAIEDTSAALAVVLVDGIAASTPSAVASAAATPAASSRSSAAGLKKLTSFRNRSPSAHSSPATKARKGSAGGHCAVSSSKA